MTRLLILLTLCSVAVSASPANAAAPPSTTKSKLTGEEIPADYVEAARHREDPKGTAFAVMLALHQLDARSLAATFYASNDDGKYAYAVARRIVAESELLKLAPAKRHPEGFMTGGPDFFSLLLLDWDIQGDSATAQPTEPNNVSAAKFLPMHKVKGSWSLDINPENLTAAQLHTAVEKLDAHSAAVEGVIGEIKSGKLKSEKQITDAIAAIPSVPKPDPKYRPDIALTSGF